MVEVVLVLRVREIGHDVRGHVVLEFNGAHEHGEREQCDNQNCEAGIHGYQIDEPARQNLLEGFFFCH